MTPHSVRHLLNKYLLNWSTYFKQLLPRPLKLHLPCALPKSCGWLTKEQHRAAEVQRRQTGSEELELLQGPASSVYMIRGF